MKYVFFGRALPAVALVAVALASPPAAAGPYTSLVIFGDSLSDNGNNALTIGTQAGQPITNTYVPTFPYAISGVYSNGPVWATDAALQLGVTLTPSKLGGTDFAYGGATTGPAVSGFPFSLLTQANQYLAATGNVASPTSLYVIEGGGNNVRAALAAIAGGAPIDSTVLATAVAYAANVGSIVNSLQAAGAQHIVVWDTPNVGAAPATLASGARRRRIGDGHRRKHERRPRCATIRRRRCLDLRHLWAGHVDLTQSGSVWIYECDRCVRSSRHRYRL